MAYNNLHCTTVHAVKEQTAAQNTYTCALCTRQSNYVHMYLQGSCKTKPCRGNNVHTVRAGLHMECRAENPGFHDRIIGECRVKLHGNYAEIFACDNAADCSA
jgi:Cu/Zn superoxide dismutase